MKRFIIAIISIAVLFAAQAAGAWANPDSNLIVQVLCGLVGLFNWTLLACVIIAIPSLIIYGLYRLGRWMIRGTNVLA